MVGFMPDLPGVVGSAAQSCASSAAVMPVLVARTTEIEFGTVLPAIRVPTLFAPIACAI